ncbi:MAG TPA: GWxTD domain-containing protein [Candidatus Krumholzibacteria bacterium]|nr:GWxTD domain-containing protein [Candidatus Krumholzibacteria bacterium]
MRTRRPRIIWPLAAVLAASAVSPAAAQPFGLFANAYLDSSRTTVTRVTVEVPFRTLVFLKKEGYYDARYDAHISVRPAGQENAPATTYVLHGFATVKTYEETRRRDQKSRSWRQIKLPPGDYVIDALLTIKNTSIGMRRSVTLRVPDFLASGLAFGTPDVLSIPTPFTQTFARWQETAGALDRADTPPDAAIVGFDRQPAVRFALFVEGSGTGSVPCDVFYEVVDLGDHQVAYGKRRVNLTGSSKDDEFVVTFNVDEWSPGLYRVNLRACTVEPQRDATASVDIRIDVTRAMLGVDFDATLEVLGLIASDSDLKPLREAPESERAAAWAKFWAARDPDPSTLENEALVQHLSRVQYAMREFSQFGPGYRSDRGRVYIRYGPPEQIDTALDQRAQGEYEIWRYYTQNRTFVFFDMFGVGDFKLVEGDL